MCIANPLNIILDILSYHYFTTPFISKITLLVLSSLNMFITMAQSHFNILYNFVTL